MNLIRSVAGLISSFRCRLMASLKACLLYFAFMVLASLSICITVYLNCCIDVPLTLVLLQMLFAYLSLVIFLSFIIDD